MGWTGGQYSLYRAALAAGVGAQLLAMAFSIASGRSAILGTGGATLLPLALLGGAYLVSAVLVFGLAAGFRDRLAAQLLAPLVVFAELVGRAPGAMSSPFDALVDTGAGRTALLPALLLLLHARVPAAPFGAFEARERTDPRGDWRRPAVQTEIGWGLLWVALAAQLFSVWHADAHASPGTRGFALAAAGFELTLATVGLTTKRARPSMWSTLALFGFAWLAAAGAAGTHDAGSDLPGALAGPIAFDLGPALLLIFACEPAWWSGRRLSPNRGDRSADIARPLPARLFYDGDCGFCHRSVRFILSEELATPAALRLRFAPLGSDTFRDFLARHPELDAAGLPDSIVLELEDGVVLTRSAAALEIASRLGGLWRLLALAGRIVPGVLLDAAYDGIARVRKRLFAKPKDVCPILPPDLRARFDP